MKPNPGLKQSKGNLISYVYGFLSFLMRNVELSSIKKIILFGSVVRGDFDEKSDIDLFIDVEKKNEKSVETNVKYALKKFYNSKGYDKWEIMGVRNDINVRVGDLKEWELKDILEKEGTVIFSSTLQEGKKHFLITFDPIKDVKRRNRVIRRLFGRKEKDFEDEGLINRRGGHTIDSRTFLIPEDYLNEVLRVLSEENVNFTMVEVWR